MNRLDQFGDIPDSFRQWDSAEVVILPVPYDGTSTWIKGADRGPAALLSASTKLERYDIETDSEPFRAGIYTDLPVTEASSPEKMVKAVRKRVSGHLDAGKFVVLVGGEHSVTIGALEAHAGRGAFSILQLDAHTDLRDTYKGSRLNHGCVMARVPAGCPVVQVGIRSMDVSEKASVRNNRLFLAEDIQQGDKWMDKVVSRLTRKVYITVDLDVFDPSIMPSTGTPEPGGMGWFPMLKLLRKVISGRNLIGFDIVELCPIKDNRAPDFLAARLLYKILGYRMAYATKQTPAQ